MLFPTTGLNQCHGANCRVLDKAIGYLGTISHTMQWTTVRKSSLGSGIWAKTWRGDEASYTDTWGKRIPGNICMENIRKYTTKPCGEGHRQGVLVSVSKQGLNDDSEQTRG